MSRSRAHCVSRIRKSDQDQGSGCIKDQDSECDQGQVQHVVMIRLMYGHSQDSGCGHDIALFGD